MLTKVYLTIILCGLVTWLSRSLPFLLLKKVKLSSWLVDFLSFVPIAIITAILFENLLTVKNGYWPILNLDNCLAAVPSLVAGLLTKNLLVIVLVGVLAMALLRLSGIN